MHQLLPLKVKIWIVVGLAGLISAIAARLQLHFVLIGTIVAATEFIVLQLLFHSWSLITHIPFVPRPKWMAMDLSGKWSGEIRSQWGDGKHELEPICVTLDLNQTWKETAFRMNTEQMHSRSNNAIPNFDPITRELQFRYFFETHPNAASTETNPPQRLGSAIARVKLDDPNRMEITYTNERGSGGDISLRRSRRRPNS